MATVDVVKKRSRIDRSLDGLVQTGKDIRFYGKVLVGIPSAIKNYPREILRILSEVSFGTGALAVIGGTIGVMTGMSIFVGTVVGMQGYAALDQIGTSTLNGFISAYFNTREIAPLVAALAMSATVGAGFTAQLGAMRINEEIDAVKVMGLGTIPYLVSTRVVAGFVAIIPLYVVGLLTSYMGSRIVTVYFHGQSAGTYDHYFQLFLPPIDILLSFGKVLIFSILIILIHCRLGFYASGGPSGVGIAVGRSVRRTIVVVALLDLALSMAMWGATTTVRIAG
ncbi:MlaE family ABC transporter permease [Nocardioides albus]|uniref:Phospholipid/cholesterol/gamma-HCH transport system permease protein n=1 Tax=Nocardioides albus TaxID=1841 RepID=A0A7W5A6T7_9ACTN|nr:ABC transporter permease [Nocardioides albus]MBB3090682.1 phospholipid/cholesterol/gamma-HCH transport system permease protein [Nocardioides albus]GGU25726.1 ABC transporter permease [Nocardioides albus]